jgi:hypothetical protein
MIYALIVCGLIGGSIGWFAGKVVAILRILLKYLPQKNFYGLCVGYEEHNDTILTNWIHKQINELSGRSAHDDALTFKELSEGKVELQFVSTNLAQNRPYVFPRMDRAGFHLVYREDELSQLFPPEVMRVLARDVDADGPQLPPGYRYLPEGKDLPVVVATRMSLAFPVLISAVPLYAVKPTAYQRTRVAARKNNLAQNMVSIHEKELQKQWFSDGGVCSNFPINMFDSWLPTYPTFGINLNYLTSDKKDKEAGLVPLDEVATAEMPDEPTKDQKVPDVYLPKIKDRAHPQWSEMTGLPGFLWAIVDTARNYRDTLHSILPSYYERIVQVWLAPHEGGMNLAMEKDKIENIAAKGQQAGLMLKDMDFDGHRRVRFRVLMQALCKQLVGLHENYDAMPKYETICQSTTAKDLEFWNEARPHVEALIALTQSIHSAKPAVDEVYKTPKFEGHLHIHPTI